MLRGKTRKYLYPNRWSPRNRSSGYTCRFHSLYYINFFLQCHCPRHKSLVILTSNVNDVRYYRFYLWPRTTLTEEGEPYYTDPDVLFLQDFLEFNSLHQQEGEVSVWFHIPPTLPPLVKNFDFWIWVPKVPVPRDSMLLWGHLERHTWVTSFSLRGLRYIDLTKWMRMLSTENDLIDKMVCVHSNIHFTRHQPYIVTRSS